MGVRSRKSEIGFVSMVTIKQQPDPRAGLN